MSDPLGPIRWIVGGRRLDARSVLPPETVTYVWRAHSNASLETPARDKTYRLGGWASAKAGAVKIARPQFLPFSPVLNFRITAQGSGSRLVLSEGLLFNSWVALTFYGACAIIVLATSNGKLDSGVLLGLLVGAALFLANRWVARNDIDLLLDHMMTVTGTTPADEWPREPVQPSIVEPGRTFGRRRG